MNPPKELQTLQDKIRAIASGNYDVEAENPKIVKCWVRLGCTNKECPAYGKLRCWSIAGTCCHGKVQGEFAQKIGDCRKCVVYRESCGDEIGELIENFNQMVKDIKYSFSEQEKDSRRKAERRRLAELGDMAAVVAHETRNPLHSIGMAVAYLKKNFKDELITEFLSIIEEEVAKLNDLTTLFLNFSHPGPLQVEPCRLAALVRETVAAQMEQAASLGIAVAVRPGDEAVTLPCDRRRVREALANIMENAIEAQPGGGEIVVRCRRLREHAVITVEDRGPGIPKEIREKACQPFFTTKTHGPGLGLAIAERTMREHNGSLEINSGNGGKGTAVSLYLPLA